MSIEEDAVVEVKTGENGARSAVEDFTVLDNTQNSDYENIRLVYVAPHTCSLRVDSTAPPLLDFRAVTSADLAMEWTHKNITQPFWSLDTDFLIELPPFLVRFSKDAEYTDFIKLGLHCSQLTDWQTVPIYRAVLRFLQTLNKVAVTRPGVDKLSQWQTMKNLKFSCDSTTGIPMLNFRTRSVQLCGIQAPDKALSLQHKRVTRETLETELMPYNHSWFRLRLRLQGIYCASWSYDDCSLTYVVA
jgi:hypothetical protein